MKVNNETPRLPLSQKGDINAKDGARLAKSNLGSNQQESQKLGSEESDIFLNKAGVIARDLPDVDKDRVNNIRQRIARGEYELEPEKIARGLIFNSIREDL